MEALALCPAGRFQQRWGRARSPSSHPMTVVARAVHRRGRAGSGTAGAATRDVAASLPLCPSRGRFSICAGELRRACWSEVARWPPTLDDICTRACRQSSQRRRRLMSVGRALLPCFSLPLPLCSFSLYDGAEHQRPDVGGASVERSARLLVRSIWRTPLPNGT
jgi:hypothetical protein